MSKSKTSTVVIERAKVEAAPDASAELQQLARDAELILGYEHLADTIIRSRPTLSEVLHKLDIEIIPYSAVKKYQAAKKTEIAKQNKASEYRYSWRQQKIQAAEDVPAFVLRKAIEIKRACPDVKLFVEALDETPDPFLIAELGRETYYVEVWDEKDFDF